MNDHSLGVCVEGTDVIRRLGSILFGDLLVGCDSNGKWTVSPESRQVSTTPRKRLLADGNIDASVVNDARTQDRLRADNVMERLIAVFILINRPVD